MKKVLVIVSDENYLEHTKYLFHSASTIGKWNGDLCLIANNVDDDLLDDFKKFNIHILNVKVDNFYYSKFFIFHKFFKNWDFVTFIDCDFTIFGNLNLIIDEETMSLPVLNVEMEPFRIHEYFCQGWCNLDKSKTLEQLYNDYNLNKFGFNSGYMSFNTSLIYDNTLNDIFKLSKDLYHINNHCEIGSDQPILNLYFINDINPIKNQKVSFWRASTNETIAQHHLHGEAPWINQDYSEKLNKTYYENYIENLNNFYKHFEKKIIK